MLAFVAIAFAGALLQRAHIPTNLVDRMWGLIFPVVGLLAIWVVFAGVRRRRVQSRDPPCAAGHPARVAPGPVRYSKVAWPAS